MYEVNWWTSIEWKIVDESVDPWLAKNTLSTTSKCQSYLQTSKRDWRPKKLKKTLRRNFVNGLLSSSQSEVWKEIFYFLIITIFCSSLTFIQYILAQVTSEIETWTHSHTRIHTHTYSYNLALKMYNYLT